jgi:maltose alpha-D-glucosyltransferase/alpha-amylase
MTRRNFIQLAKSRHLFESPFDQELAERILAAEKEVLAHMAKLMGRKIPTAKTRIHGDYHLGQVLFTGKDFVIIDFEGEPARTMSERRLKRSPLRDVAGMIRSFHYAAQTALRHQRTLPPGDAALLEPWLEFWTLQIGARFLSAYRTRLGDMPFIPREEELLEDLLRAFLLEKAVYELGYELNNRPGWVRIPLQGIRQILGKGD